jgi:hypothetical protein
MGYGSVTILAAMTNRPDNYTSAAPPVIMNGFSMLFNARFATRPASGVDRVAGELLRALGSMWEEQHSRLLSLSLALPKHPPWHPQAALSLDDLSTMPHRRGRLGGHLWEQVELPHLSPNAWLISPCNTGPILRSKQLIIIHDAQTFLAPSSYSWAFRNVYNTSLPAWQNPDAFKLSLRVL